MATLATDDFNRADAGTLGANWTAKRHNPGIFSNQVDVTVASDENISRYSGVAWPNDQWAQATCVVGAAATRVQAVGIRLEAAASRQGYYGGHDRFNTGDGARRIWKWVGATWTSLASESINIAASDVIYVEVQGSTLKLFVNGVERLSSTDTSLTLGQAGMIVGDAAVDVALLDDWSGGDFASAVPGAGFQPGTSRHPGRSPGVGALSGRFVQTPSASVTIDSISGSDTAGGAEASAIQAGLTDSDTATGAEASAILAGLTASDSAAEGESAAVVAAFTATDAAAGADAVAGVQAGIAVSEAPAATEAQQLDAFSTVSESGVGSESTAVTAAFSTADTGAGSEATMISVALTGTDTGGAGEATATQAGIGGAESGAGAEGSTLASSSTVGDTGAATEGATVDTGGGSISKVGAETASATESASVVASGSAVPFAKTEDLSAAGPAFRFKPTRAIRPRPPIVVDELVFASETAMVVRSPLPLSELQKARALAACNLLGL